MGSTQYDAMVSAYNGLYDDLESLPCGKLEEANLHVAVKDHITGKRVLDLACGSGHYSRRFLEWGAKSVLGVDISAGMVEEARSRATELEVGNDRLSYLIADVSRDLDLSTHGGPFDVVTGTWLLNYASSATEMEGMWKTILRNCRPGGRFFGLTIPPPLSNRQELNRSLMQEWAVYGTSGHVKREVRDGFEVHIVLGIPGAASKVEFDNFYLRFEAFDESAEAAGASGALEWLPTVVPEDLRNAFPMGYWNLIVLNPHFRICRIAC